MALDPTLLIGLKALELYLDDMVIAGGWVPYLFAAHEQPSAEAVALKTRDLDVAADPQGRCPPAVRHSGATQYTRADAHRANTGRWTS